MDRAGSLQSDVAEVERDLSLRRLLWESSEQWSRFVKIWQEQPFENLNVEEMQKSVGKLIQTIYLLEKGWCLKESATFQLLRVYYIFFQNDWRAPLKVNNGGYQQKNSVIYNNINNTIFIHAG